MRSETQEGLNSSSQGRWHHISQTLAAVSACVASAGGVLLLAYGSGLMSVHMHDPLNIPLGHQADAIITCILAVSVILISCIPFIQHNLFKQSNKNMLLSVDDNLRNGLQVVLADLELLEDASMSDRPYLQEQAKEACQRLISSLESIAMMPGGDTGRKTNDRKKRKKEDGEKESRDEETEDENERVRPYVLEYPLLVKK